MMRSTVRSAGLAILLTVNGCGSFIASDPGTKTPGLSVAEAALEGGAGQIALQVSEGVLRDSPNNVRAMAVKGDALTLLGEYDQAAATFQAILAKDPNSVRANIGLGRIRLNKDPAAAETLFQTVLKREPKDLTALNNLGIARDLQGHHADAQTAYRQALAINPELDSAQVNLALSLAMTGHGPEAVQLLKARASDPNAPVKVRRDYAVVLAMAGNRPEAERVLSDDLPADQVRQVLDSATGVHSPVPRDTSPARVVATSQSPRDEPVPPDVVQVPEGQMAPARRPVAFGTVMTQPGQTQVLQTQVVRTQVSETQAASSVTRPAAVTAPAMAPAPMVVRPTSTDAEAPMVQPVNTIAAAMTNQRPLALPLHSAELSPPADETSADAPSGHAPRRESAAESALVTPEVLRMPATKPGERAVAAMRAPPVRMASADPVSLPDAPPPPAVLAAAPLPPAWHSPVARAVAEPPVASAPPVRSMLMAMATVAAPSQRAEDEVTTSPRPRQMAAAEMPEIAARPMAATAAAFTRDASSRDASSRDVQSRDAHSRDAHSRDTQSGDSGLAVQFAATASEDAAHAFWQALARRFPEVLGQREPTVIRFEHGGSVFWRVRTEGFGTLAEAQTLCARMRADGQACFVPRS
jgi:Flp pilus assembly protein TadD